MNDVNLNYHAEQSMKSIVFLSQERLAVVEIRDGQNGFENPFKMLIASKNPNKNAKCFFKKHFNC